MGIPFPKLYSDIFDRRQTIDSSTIHSILLLYFWSFSLHTSSRHGTIPFGVLLQKQQPLTVTWQKLSLDILTEPLGNHCIPTTCWRHQRLRQSLGPARQEILKFCHHHHHYHNHETCGLSLTWFDRKRIKAILIRIFSFAGEFRSSAAWQRTMGSNPAMNGADHSFCSRLIKNKMKHLSEMEFEVVVCLRRHYVVDRAR